MHNQLIEPSRDFADLVLPLDRTNDSGIDMLVRSIATLVSQQPARLIESPVDGSEMLLVPGGTFLMGTSDSHIDEMLREYGAQIHWFNDERPFHAVGLKSYYVDKYPVTNNQYRSFVKATGRDEPATWTIRRHTEPSQPVTGVSWEDAKAYAGWAGKRLPSEAEWEKAARGINARLFPWGSAPPEGRANFGGKYGGPTIVNKFPDGASPYGVMDMAGNVWEWAADWYDRDYYSKSPKDDPTGPPAGAGRCVRGGCWVNNPTMIRCAERDVRRLPLPELKYFGFRCAADV
jgi:formylglycine-generating enzyme required for sulfatase activity